MYSAHDMHRTHEDHRPTFQICFLFHKNLALFERTLPACIEALTRGSEETYEIVIHCDGTPPEVVPGVIELAEKYGVDEVRLRSRAKYVANGDPSNNGHRRLFDGDAPFRIVVEDDVVMFRSEAAFDVLHGLRTLLERHDDVPVVCKLDDVEKWSWQLIDMVGEIEPGVRSVNRVATHFIAYQVERFRSVADRFGAFDLDVFIDRDDLSYNWEDLVSHVGSTGGRRIAFPEGWPLHVFHCDVKVADGSMYNTQDPEVKVKVLDELEARFGRTGFHSETRPSAP